MDETALRFRQTEVKVNLISATSLHLAIEGQCRRHCSFLLDNASPSFSALITPTRI